MERRTYLLTAGAATPTLLAGCTDQLSGSESTDATPGTSDSDDRTTTDRSGDGTPERGDTGEGTATDDGEADSERALETPEAAVEAYLAAASAEDEAAIADVMHSEAPLNPADRDDVEFSFEPFDAVDPADVEITNVRKGVATDEILDLEQASFWFEEDEIDDRIGDETTAFATVETGIEEADRRADTWVLVTEDDGWRVFFIGTTELSKPGFEEIREPAVIDEDETVVENVEWDVEPYVDDFEMDGKLVEVQFTDSPGVEADTVRAETAVAGGNAELYDDTDGNATTTWADSRVAIEFDPSGDQIEVFAIDDGEETLVHREHYDP